MATVLLDRILGVLALFMVGAFASFSRISGCYRMPIVRMCVAFFCGPAPRRR